MDYLKNVKRGKSVLNMLLAAFILVGMLHGGVVSASDVQYMVVSGKIGAIDRQKGIVTVKGIKLQLTDLSVIQGDQGQVISLSDLKNGYSVGCEYLSDESGEVNRIHRLILLSKYYSHKIPAR